MNKILLLNSLLIILRLFHADAQWIDAVTVYPPNPIAGDEITILADCSFSSGSCNEHTQSFAIDDTSIYGWALHCVGSLAVICSYTDTFKIGTLTPGTYTFTFQLDAGGLPSPCTPGIVAGPSSTITFTVGVETGDDYVSASENQFSLYPNPADHELIISSKDVFEYSREISVYTVAGEKVIYTTFSGSMVRLNTTQLPDGIYFIEAIPSSSNARSFFVVQH